MSNSYYLLSSFKENPDFFFDGYCFVDSNFIFGEGGSKKYIAEKGGRIKGGEDGCYIIAYRDNDEYIISNDYGGYKKILYYYDPIGKVWAVSNSLNILVKHLRDFGINIIPNLSLLNFHSSAKGVASQQPVSFDTIARGIYLLPTSTTLKIINNRIKIENNVRFEKNLDYSEVFSRFISIWIARFQTIFSEDGVFIRQALTGGVDSRAVFSLTSLARKKLENQELAIHSFNCGKIRGDSKDLEVATEISSHYGYALNSNISKFRPNYLNGIQTYQRWKNLSLGVYFPIYFDARSIDPMLINISGGGGEKYRPYYRINSEDNFQKFSMRNASQIKDYASQFEVDANMLNSMKYLTSKSNQDPLQIHYAEFRNRLHSGFFPQFIVDISPLNSYLLAEIANKFPKKINTSQLLYDLINLEKEALNFNFDKDNKNPTQLHISDLTSFNQSYNLVSKGKCYFDHSLIDDNKVLSSSYDSSHLIYLEKDLNNAFSNVSVQSIWDKDFLNKVQITAEELFENKKLSHAIEGIPISCFIASSMFYE